MLLLFAVEVVAISYVCSSPKWCESSLKADSACKIDVLQRQHLWWWWLYLSLVPQRRHRIWWWLSLSLWYHKDYIVYGGGIGMVKAASILNSLQLYHMRHKNIQVRNKKIREM